MKTIVVPVEFVANKGGVPQSIISLASGLAQKGRYRVILLCPKDSDMSRHDFPPGVTIITSEDNNWSLSKSHFFSSIRVSLDLYKKLKIYVNSDTLFLTNHVGASYIVSLMPFKRKKEIYVNRGGNFDSYTPLSLLMKYKLSHNKIYYAVATSEKQRLMLTNVGLPEDRSCVIHNGLPLPLRDYSFRPLNPNLLRISTMGFLSDLKGQHIGVQLISLLCKSGYNAVLNLYGEPSSDTEYNRYLRDVILETGMSGHVFFKGFITGEELFSETDILISFSKREGFGRSLVEGMLRKIPVIAYRGAGGPVDITKNGQYCHLVEENNAEAYLDVVLSLLKHPEDNKNNVLASYEYACAMFTEDVMVNNYVKMFNDIYNTKALQ